MRVIAGTYGGRLLKIPPKNADFRPTTDRVRESLFNILEHSFGISGATVCDLFAGTGSLGIEALSRGAVSAVFVEQSRINAGVISSNLQSLGLAGISMVNIAPVERFLGSASQKFDIMFCDPPYKYEKTEEILAAIASRPLLCERGILVFEHGGKTALSPPLPWRVLQTRSYGTTAITIMELES